MARYGRNNDLGDFLTGLSTVKQSGAAVWDLIRILFRSSAKGKRKIKAGKPHAPRDVRNWLNKLNRQAKSEDRKAAKQLRSAMRKSEDARLYGPEPLPGAAAAGLPPGGPPTGLGGGAGGSGAGGGGGGDSGAGGDGGGPGGIYGAIPMERVTSSNVYAIGYDHDTGTLRVQYHPYVPGRPKGSAGNGPLYDYYDVPARLWKQFQGASSKGKWIWDRMRVRGTISGHRYEYRLVFATLYVTNTGIRSYVPRLATGKGYEKRTRIVFGRKVRSSLPAGQYHEGKKKSMFKGR